MKLKEAKFCLECEGIFASCHDGRCPFCAGLQWLPLSNWINHINGGNPGPVCCVPPKETTDQPLWIRMMPVRVARWLFPIGLA